MGDRISFSRKSNSFDATVCRIENPGRNKTNRTLPVTERAGKPPTKNSAQPRKEPKAKGIYFGICSCGKCNESTSMKHYFSINHNIPKLY